MKRLFVITVFTSLFLTSAIMAQSFNTNDSLRKSFITEKQMSLHMTAGTAFMTGFNKTGSMMSTYLAPELNYKLSKRFTLDAGLVVMNSSYNLFHPAGDAFQAKPFSINFTNTFLFAGGQYQLNDRLTLNGQVYTQLNTFATKSDLDHVYDANLKGVKFGMDYKVSEHSTIGIEFNIANKPSPYNYSPTGFPYQNPFYGR
jgi:hypothetical protein